MNPFIRIVGGVLLTLAIVPATGWSDEPVATTLGDPSPAPAAVASATVIPPFVPALDVAVVSRYVFQGIDYSDGRSSVQPNFSLTHGILVGNVWANYQPNLGDVNEVDLSLKLTHSAGPLSVAPGVMALRYPNRDWSSSMETFVDLGLQAPGNPTLSVHYDFRAGDGLYATLGLAHTLPAPFTLGANLFYQRRYYGMTGVPAVELKAGTTLPFGSFMLTPSLSRFVTTANGTFRDEARIPSGWLIAVDVAPKE